MVAVSTAEYGGWQGIRNQLFGQQRERDAEDGLLRVITQLQTALALATGLNEGPLRNPAQRAQALRAVQDGLNGLIAWHKEQLKAAQSIGGWNGPAPDLGSDVLGAVQTLRPLFEAAEIRNRALDCRDVIQSVAQLRGPESDAFFNEALDGLVAMLEAVYVRIGIDAPTASVAVNLRDLWDILLDELRALRCEDAVVVEAEVEPAVEAPVLVAEPEPLPAVFETAVAVAEVPAAEVPAAEVPVVVMAQVIELARFRRLELVAC
jgi:hypothetical protein